MAVCLTSFVFTSIPHLGVVHAVVMLCLCRYFSPFAAVSLLGVAGLAETSPSFSVSGPFLLDFPRFQVPSDCIVPSQLRSSPRALPLHLHFHNCSDVFSFMSSFDVPEPFQPSPSHNCCYWFHLCLFQDLLIGRGKGGTDRTCVGIH